MTTPSSTDTTNTPAPVPTGSDTGAPDDAGPVGPFVPGVPPGASVLDGPAIMPLGAPSSDGNGKSRSRKNR